MPLFSKEIDIDLSQSNAPEQVSSVPFYSLKVAAGHFGSPQTGTTEIDQIPLPPSIRYSDELFACQIIGESMNKKIPNGAICLFRRYSGGSRNGKIVLVELTDPQEDFSGSCYTIKEYQSQKKATSDSSYEHTEINLIPHSTDSRFTIIRLVANNVEELKVVGIFECILSLPQ
jgi:SOS-response transcriptional repressor LexA